MLLISFHIRVFSSSVIMSNFVKGPDHEKIQDLGEYEGFFFDSDFRRVFDTRSTPRHLVFLGSRQK